MLTTWVRGRPWTRSGGPTLTTVAPTLFPCPPPHPVGRGVAAGRWRRGARPRLCGAGAGSWPSGPRSGSRPRVAMSSSARVGGKAGSPGGRGGVGRDALAGGRMGAAGAMPRRVGSARAGVKATGRPGFPRGRSATSPAVPARRSEGAADRPHDALTPGSTAPLYVGPDTVLCVPASLTPALTLRPVPA